MNTKLALFTIPALLFSAGMQAGQQSGKTISTVHVNIGSGYYFKTVEPMVDTENCGNSTWYKLKNSTYTKDAYSLILAAKMSGKKVEFYLKGCSGNYPQVDWINVYD